jgi:F-type H+-transporting ATPase subunit gamma
MLGMLVRRGGLQLLAGQPFATKNLKAIKNRMRAVNSIKKITKAMKMVAASKMKQDVGRLERAKFFGISSVAKVLENEPYLQKKKPAPSSKRTLLVPVTTDKGLCGGINSGVVREVKAMLKEDRNSYRLIVLGDKGCSGLLRPFPELVDSSITNLQLPLNFATAGSIAYRLTNKVDDLDCDRMVVLYNHFKNIISQTLTKAEVMTRKTFKTMFKYVVKHDVAEPDKDFAVNHFYDFYVATLLYNAMLNNMASETSSRMNAMENASKNAGEIVDKLTLEYNKARQAKITMELCEIISGASAV